MNWDSLGDMKRVIDDTGRIVGRVCPALYVTEWEAVVNGKWIGEYRTEGQAIAAVEAKLADGA
jgi:hypothetical protein